MAAASSAKDGSGDISLLEYLDLSQINCLNEVDHSDLKSIISSRSRNTTSAMLLSDVDEQLLLNIPFNQAVRVRSIVIQSNDRLKGPKVIKLFVNRPALGFEDVQHAEAAQILTLSEQDIKNGNRLLLRFVRFQSVNSLHIFVESNQGAGEEKQTQIDAVDILGIPVEATKSLSGLKELDG
ncbi:PITH domain-containing protein [Hygrophoropsis aurantiaca]|uniref:PITH domain-containing protein n=1 Tax=Hygrophoropsis aurantiaca TaxID=72124 RepID=A0ACB8A4F5_9AGAM|nr:PITH domain-containing protein [Hygrophoropsis aurantiaca]